MRLVLGVDSSTQSTKVEARDITSGELLASGKSPHPPTVGPASEQDPNKWWDALVAACRQLGDHRKDVVGISVAGQQHGLVLIDDAGQAVRPARLWNDTTSAPNAAALVDELGADVWAEACGSVPVASFTISKLAWMAENEPESLARTAQIMLPHDYLTWRLTDSHVTDRGDASGSGWFDPASSQYRVDLLGAAISNASEWIDRLPSVLGAHQAAGELTARAAQALGLPEGIMVGPGTGDNMAAALGLGLRTGDIAMSLGTSGTVYSVSAAPTADPTGLVAGFADANGLYLPLVCTLNATQVTDTVASWLGTDAAGLSRLALDAPVEPDGVVLVPYFEGERTPNLPNATGHFAGLRTSTTREVLARAAHDGVLCGLFDGLDALAAAGVAIGGRLLLIGGGARSSAYRQRCADLRGSQIAVPEADEVVATGAAVQAGAVVTGESIATVTDAWNLGASTTVDPNPNARGNEIRQAFSSVAAGI